MSNGHRCRQAMVTSRNSERPSGVIKIGARSAVTSVKK